MPTRDDPLWIFGYGSLVWRPAFPHEDRRPGFVRGFARRFWQGSTDHRGIPEAPGRVVTLVSAPDEHCWGMAYRIASDRREEVLSNLDHRERGGFERLELRVHFREPGAAAVEALVYVATEDNPNYLGAAPVADIAAQIRRCRGPSGANSEYALRLARALREMRAFDAHVFEVADLVGERPEP